MFIGQLYPTSTKTAGNVSLLVFTVTKNQKTPSDHENDRINKYAKYFKENEILPIPELVQAVESKTLSFVITDLKTRRLTGLKKETFEEVIKNAGIPGKYFYRRSFATGDVLLPSEEIAKKLATKKKTTVQRSTSGFSQDTAEKDESKSPHVTCPCS